MRSTCLAPALLAIALAAPAARAASTERASAPPTVTTLTVERERPVREKLPTLQFLRANRDFIRARFDRLRLESHDAHAGAGDIDPRFLAYRRLLAEIAASKDSVARASDARGSHRQPLHVRCTLPSAALTTTNSEGTPCAR